MPKIKHLFLSTRPQFFPGIMIPVALGASAAWHTHGKVHIPYFLISLIAATLFHAGMNVINDYFDFKNGTDNINQSALTPFTGGSRFIQSGLISPRETLVFGLSLLALGSLAGLYLSYAVNPLLLIIGSIGLFVGFFYSAPPIFLAGRGLGEAAVGLCFGVLTVLGAYLVQTNELGPHAFFSSIPMSFLIAALLYINEFPDYEADKTAGKRTLVVRLGVEKGRYGILVIIGGAYASIIVAAISGFLPLRSLIAILSIVAVIPGVLGLLKNYKGGPSLIPSIKSIILAHLSTGILLIISNII
ncbi:MAG: 1,4-dihydroxy-2-naphthoate octaprenyltransferase [Deltaproteobacteria bacterium]|nr:1,4-dihydroxy-2-naphthoate octaprenyltransferase [Deltaproteobacteria bacterium]